MYSWRAFAETKSVLLFKGFSKANFTRTSVSSSSPGLRKAERSSSALSLELESMKRTERRRGSAFILSTRRVDGRYSKAIARGQSLH
jgi:hypothetical protein